MPGCCSATSFRSKGSYCNDWGGGPRDEGFAQICFYDWLAGEDSNLHSRLQRPVSCHWTTGHQRSFYDITTEEFTAREVVFVYYGVGFVAAAAVSSMNRAV